MADGANLAAGDYGQHPERLHDLSLTELYSISATDVERIQLEALNKRFNDLVGKVAMLGRLADEQKITGFSRIQDAGPLLFPHSHYKSYSLSVLETGRFDRLNRWLGGLTSIDLSQLDLEGVDTIDAWIDALDAQTPIRVIHSSGTTGKLSFLPRTAIENRRAAIGFQRAYEGFADEPNAPLIGLKDCPYIVPTYRKGAMGLSRSVQNLICNLYDGDESMVLTLSPGRMSADMLSLSGRIRVAESKGEAGRLQISPALLARRVEFLKEQAEAPSRRQAFFEDLAQRLGGRRVILSGNWSMLYDVAAEAQKRGLTNIFAADSFLFVAGGLKGRDLPADYREVIQQVLGIPEIRSGYGMSEMPQMMPACPLGAHHIQPHCVPYLLDPNTGQQLPRTGQQTGRFGFIDLMAETYWGGFLSGDEVTINWGDQERCACGRIGPYILPAIRRYSEQEGGDDKITCAGAPEAHDKALDFLTGLA